MKVLDLGCGDGTTAISAAKFGADVPASTSPAISSRQVTVECRRKA
jgi:cyclopropane fatty-acyl-phospholipid synthase-like methyltransferase